MVTVIVEIPAVGDKPGWSYTYETKLPEVEVPYVPPPIKEICEIGDEQTTPCPDGTEVVTAICKKDPTTGRNRWVPTGKTCPPAPPKEICEIGEEKTIFCPADGSTIVVYICERDPTTGRNRWVPTGKTCPPAPPKEICEIGEEKTIFCPADGSTIVAYICERDPTTGRNRWVPTGRTCPAPELGKTAKILVYPEGAPLEAYEGMDVTITANVMCGAMPSDGETATFFVNGVKLSQAKTVSGFVTFRWTATAEPSRTHKVCVSVPKSEQCPKFGEARDCKTITVRRVIPGIEEQLRIEREEYAKRLEALRLERERIRALPQPAITVAPIPVTIPALPAIPGITVPTIPAVPEVPVPKGKISIPSVGIPPGIEFPVIIYIDGERIGSPPITIDADPGTHTVRVELKGFPTIYRKISVTSGEIISLTDLRFM